MSEPLPKQPSSTATAGMNAELAYVGDIALGPLAAPPSPPAPSSDVAPAARNHAGHFEPDGTPPAAEGGDQLASDAGEAPERRAKPRGYVVPRKPARVLNILLGLMPVAVRKGFRPQRHEALFAAKPPTPAADFESRRIDILLSLHTSVRECIERWEDRMFQAFGVSMAAILTVVGVYLEHPAELNARRLLVAGLVLTFGTLAGLYFWRAADARSENGALLVKIEAALGLCEEGAYLKGESFYGWSGVWLPDRRSPVLFTALVVVTVLAAVVIAVYPLSSGGVS
ncbi:MAG TPA: hypothetical protein VFS20_14695 [Longimicrobium sp.]|nr:hypothetical protein [Longimicrobium sp.]